MNPSGGNPSEKKSSYEWNALYPKRPVCNTLKHSNI